MPRRLRKLARLGRREYVVSLRKLAVLVGAAGFLELAAVCLLVLLLGWLGWLLLVASAGLVCALANKQFTSKSLERLLQLEQKFGTGPDVQVTVTPVLIGALPVAGAMACVGLIAAMLIVMAACVFVFAVVGVVVFGGFALVLGLLFLAVYWAVIHLWLVLFAVAL